MNAKRVVRLFFISLAIVVLASFYGCASTTKDSGQLEPVQTVWPLPPETPRYRYVGSLQSLEDLSKKTSFLDMLAGEEQESVVGLSKPYGVHSDAQGRIFVADTGLGGLPVFELGKGAVSVWGSTGLGKLQKPVGVSSESAGPVYVSDALQKRIVKFDVNGNYLTAFGGEEELQGPAGIVFIEQSQRLYVADVKRHQVLVYTPDGVLESVIGERGTGESQFNFPTNLATDKEGRLYVADTMNFRVQILEPDGRFIRSIGTLGRGFGSFNRLKGIGVDSDGNIYCVDASFNNFQVFDPEGNLLIFVGSGGKAPGQFYLPAGAYVDSNDRIFIADQYNQRVQVFQYLSDQKK